MKFKELRDRINELWDNEMISDEAEVYFEDKLAGYGGAIDDVEYIDIDKEGNLILLNAICDEEEYVSVYIGADSYRKYLNGEIIPAFSVKDEPDQINITVPEHHVLDVRYMEDREVVRCYIKRPLT